MRWPAVTSGWCAKPALAALPAALNVLATVLVPTGAFARAAESIAENVAITQITGGAPLPNAGLMLAAWRGRQAEASELYSAAVQDATGRGEGAVVTLAQYELAVLHNGLGNYDAALAAAQQACASDEQLHSVLALPELVEAAARAGQPDRAATAHR